MIFILHIYGSIFHATGLFLYLMNVSEDVLFSDVFMGLKELIGMKWVNLLLSFRSSTSELSGEGVLKTCSKFTGEHPCRSAISMNLFCNFIEITPLSLVHIFIAPFSKNSSGKLLFSVGDLELAERNKRL